MYNLLFDFDGTLFDTDRTHYSSFVETFKKFNYNIIPNYEEIKGKKTIDVFFETVGDYRIAKEMSEFKSNLYQSKLSEIRPLANFALLHNVKESGNRIFIVSGGRRSSIDKLLSRHNINNLFDGIICAEDYVISKPSPDAFLTCITKYNLNGLILGIEDSIQGIQSLINAGICSIGVHNEQISIVSDYFYSNINEFLMLLLVDNEKNNCNSRRWERK